MHYPSVSLAVSAGNPGRGAETPPSWTTVASCAADQQVVGLQLHSCNDQDEREAAPATLGWTCQVWVPICWELLFFLCQGVSDDMWFAIDDPDDYCGQWWEAQRRLGGWQGWIRSSPAGGDRRHILGGSSSVCEDTERKGMWHIPGMRLSSSWLGGQCGRGSAGGQGRRGWSQPGKSLECHAKEPGLDLQRLGTLLSWVSSSRKKTVCFQKTILVAVWRGGEIRNRDS